MEEARRDLGIVETRRFEVGEVEEGAEGEVVRLARTVPSGTKTALSSQRGSSRSGCRMRSMRNLDLRVFQRAL